MNLRTDLSQPQGFDFGKVLFVTFSSKEKVSHSCMRVPFPVHSTMTIRDSILINRTPDKVWAFVENPELMKQWNPKVQWVTAGAQNRGQGFVYAITYLMSGKAQEFRAEFVANEQKPQSTRRSQRKSHFHYIFSLRSLRLSFYGATISNQQSPNPTQPYTLYPEPCFPDTLRL